MAPRLTRRTDRDAHPEEEQKCCHKCKILIGQDGEHRAHTNPKMEEGAYIWREKGNPIRPWAFAFGGCVDVDGSTTRRRRSFGTKNGSVSISICHAAAETRASFSARDRVTLCIWRWRECTKAYFIQMGTLPQCAAQKEHLFSSM